MLHINYNEFVILRLQVQPIPSLTQREISKLCNISLGLVNATIGQLKDKGLLDSNGKITLDGQNTLSNYQVDNAIIMAAGTSSRFAPLSYDKPKGLLKVRGEVLIERQIKQLKDAGINDIIIVLGYMKEQFFYLEEKFGVQIIINKDYYRYNNTSTLLHVLSSIKNSYICSSDNYFTENPFYQYEYKAYYPVVQGEDLPTEYYVDIGPHNRITNIVIGKGEYFLIGYAYFDKNFSNYFSQLLTRRFNECEIKSSLWERLLIEHIDELEIFAYKIKPDTVREFDCLSDLQSFDPYYINNTDNEILGNIMDILKCELKDIQNIIPLKEGMTNLSFSFEIAADKYVYRHPGIGTDAYIDRKAEYFAQTMARNYHIDDTFIHMSFDEGWKISHFIENARLLDYHNKYEVSQALQAIKSLHDLEIVDGPEFDLWNKTQNYFNNIESKGRTNFEGFDSLSEKMIKLFQLTKEKNVKKVLCHCDFFNTNILFSKDKHYIIDWEYAGLEDPIIDVSTFIACSDYSYEEAVEVLAMYHGGCIPNDLLKHYIAYIALSAYYWFAWALYQDSRGVPVGEYLYIWYKYAIFYGTKALELYKESSAPKV